MDLSSSEVKSAEPETSPLKQNIKVVHGPKKFECDLCDYKPTTKSHLKSHINCVHLKDKSHKCDMCSYATASKSVLRRHVNGVHLKLKPKHPPRLAI